MASDQGQRREERETRELLLVRLSSQELVTKAEELARHLQETTSMKASTKRAAKLAAEEIKEREQREADLAQEISSGAEAREVTCRERPRYDDLLVDLVRVDTGEVVRTRAMQPSERQQAIFFEPDDREDPNPRAPHN